MKYKVFGVFGKVFFYTLIIALFIISVLGIFFSNQINAVINETQRRQTHEVFEPLMDELLGKEYEEMLEIADSFHKSNSSFEFCLIDDDGEILYETEGFVMFEVSEFDGLDQQSVRRVIEKNFFKNEYENLSQHITLVRDGIKLYVINTSVGQQVFDEFFLRAITAIALILLVSIIAAVIFARRFSHPIQKIADDTRRMSNLEYVPSPKIRKDEIGQLAADVYKMYGTLKDTIGRLEDEIEHVKSMEESQHYFFSAAGHELKTPVAATKALLEGMTDGVIEQSEYPHYTQECLKMMNKQTELISDILEIASMNRRNIALQKTPVNLNSLIASVLPTYQTLAETNGQVIDVNIPDDIVCLLDEALLYKVLSNLLMNAVQNTPAKGRISIWTENKKGAICFNILNEGARIDEEILSKLFEPFYRIDKARSRNQGRSGLGLTLVKKALDIMDVNFAMENTAAGVLFWMDLPL